jgi:hypothetical protein
VVAEVRHDFEGQVATSVGAMDVDDGGDTHGTSETLFRSLGTHSIVPVHAECSAEGRWLGEFGENPALVRPHRHLAVVAQTRVALVPSSTRLGQAEASGRVGIRKHQV